MFTASKRSITKTAHVLSQRHLQSDNHTAIAIVAKLAGECLLHIIALWQIFRRNDTKKYVSTKVTEKQLLLTADGNKDKEAMYTQFIDTVEHRSAVDFAFKTNADL